MEEKQQNTLEDSVRFVAKHYKTGTFNSKEAWTKIEKRIAPQQKVRKLSPYYGAAAAVAIIALVSVFYLSINRGNKTLYAQTDNTAFVLRDSTFVNMQKGAELVYDKNFGITERRVSMRGNITFNVARDEQKPFIIATPAAQVRVLGTVFTVDENDKNVRLSVESGLVQFTPADPAIPLLCEAGARVHFVTDKKLVEVAFPQGFMSISGMDNKLVFNNVSLKDVVLVLSHYYNKSIQLPEEEASLTFTSSFTQKSVIEIINIINFTLDTNIKIEK